jgi:hypothetical protein
MPHAHHNAIGRCRSGGGCCAPLLILVAVTLPVARPVRIPQADIVSTISLLACV